MVDDVPHSEMESALAERLRVAMCVRGWRLALAESCTGGMLGAAVTSVAGASEYFVGGLVTYANEAKVRLLGVDRAVLARHGAVSDVVARRMAEGALRALGADVALAVTGIAGPSGGSADKPVGTVWFGLAVAGAGSPLARHARFGGERAQVRRAAVLAGLRWLLDVAREGST